MYHGCAGGATVLAYGCTGVPAWQRRVLPLAYPPVVRLIDRVPRHHAGDRRRSLREVRATFDAVAERLADGRRTSCGDRFTAAD